MTNSKSRSILPSTIGVNASSRFEEIETSTRSLSCSIMFVSLLKLDFAMTDDYRLSVMRMQLSKVVEIWSLMIARSVRNALKLDVSTLSKMVTPAHLMDQARLSSVELVVDLSLRKKLRASLDNLVRFKKCFRLLMPMLVFTEPLKACG